MPRSPFDPCIPTKAAKVPDRPEWIHEIKHDGYAWRDRDVAFANPKMPVSVFRHSENRFA